jgi:hypothetical protein
MEIAEVLPEDKFEPVQYRLLADKPILVIEKR